MHCTERDQEILLLQHGELSPWQAFWVKLHLTSCPHCQERQAEQARISRLVAGAIRQEGNLPPFSFRGETGALATLSPVPPAHFTPTRQAFRPAFLVVVSSVAAIIAAGAYVYKATALTLITPENETTFEARSSFFASPESVARDARGRPTIFPYSTPNLHDNCDKK